MGLYEALRSTPIGVVDPMGTDVWIEGANENEPAGHVSIAVGDPQGDYSSYSFGVEGTLGDRVGLVTFGADGFVYEDIEKFGPILDEHYYPTTRGQDFEIKKLLRGMVKMRSTHLIGGANCLTFSFNSLEDLISRYGLTPGTPPERTGQETAGTTIGRVTTTTSVAGAGVGYTTTRGLTEAAVLKSSGFCFIGAPGLVVFDHDIQDSQQLAHGGDDDDLEGFACGAEATHYHPIPFSIQLQSQETHQQQQMYRSGSGTSPFRA